MLVLVQEPISRRLAGSKAYSILLEVPGLRQKSGSASREEIAKIRVKWILSLRKAKA